MASAGASAASAPVVEVGTMSASTDAAEAGPSGGTAAPPSSSGTTSHHSHLLPSPSFSSRSHAGGGSGGAQSQLSPRAPTTAPTSVTHHHHDNQNALLLLHPNLPSPSSPQQTAQARAALVGTISNLLDSELQSRAELLHQNARALEGQERDVAKATEALRKENDKLLKVVREGSRKVLETGNVQNWAEVLERDFLVLEDTMRRVRRGPCSDPDCSGCSSGTGSWSGSRTPSRRGSFGDADGPDGPGPPGRGTDKGKGKMVEEVVVPGLRGADGEMDIDEVAAQRESSGRQDGSFATVNNAIVASISEAMAASIGDMEEPSCIEPRQELETGPEGLSEMVVDVDQGEDRPGAVESVERVVTDSTEMDVDDRSRIPVVVPNTLDEREIQALEAIGLSPELNSSHSTDQRITDVDADGIPVNEDKMDIDASDGTVNK
ncbi:hypothetical protein BKA67DRAFT_580417 [Truncatella angustata]|uniref:Biogenesis of lysosome-related organelles complex 1 subunit 1 n=1 Tax=Truncatella angustata TaxID=152316 RepID=A0A9P8UCI4_9PEZI|nr:uncharacterized protein BKA67DRAFT_580417 [Truncatella angustata]KAH6646731.1 hypothetical protein BKA67DRAFT_580417 [Truncatella angustata]